MPAEAMLRAPYSHQNGNVGDPRFRFARKASVVVLFLGLDSVTGYVGGYVTFSDAPPEQRDRIVNAGFLHDVHPMSTRRFESDPQPSCGLFR